MVDNDIAAPSRKFISILRQFAMDNSMDMDEIDRYIQSFSGCLSLAETQKNWPNVNRKSVKALKDRMLKEIYSDEFSKGIRFELHHFLPKEVFPEYEDDPMNMLWMPRVMHYVAHMHLARAVGCSEKLVGEERPRTAYSFVSAFCFNFDVWSTRGERFSEECAKARKELDSLYKDLDSRCKVGERIYHRMRKDGKGYCKRGFRCLPNEVPDGCIEDSEYQRLYRSRGWKLDLDFLDDDSRKFLDDNSDCWNEIKGEGQILYDLYRNLVDHYEGKMKSLPLDIMLKNIRKMDDPNDLNSIIRAASNRFGHVVRTKERS